MVQRVQGRTVTPRAVWKALGNIYVLMPLPNNSWRPWIECLSDQPTLMSFTTRSTSNQSRWASLSSMPPSWSLFCSAEHEQVEYFLTSMNLQFHLNVIEGIACTRNLPPDDTYICPVQAWNSVWALIGSLDAAQQPISHASLPMQPFIIPTNSPSTACVCY